MRAATIIFLFVFLGLFRLPIAAGRESSPTRSSGSVPLSPRFESDVSQVPELQPWGRAAEALCQVWYPRIVAILKSDDTARPLPPVARLVFEKDMRGVAYASGSEIHIAADWVRSHPNDFGMVVHELTHLVQRYPRNRGAGWLVEGIADYVRLKHFEPLVAVPRIDFTKAKYTDSYKTTAGFLIWLEDKYGADLVPRLNAALRAGSYTDARFKEITGKEVEDLWSDFAAAQRLATQSPSSGARQSQSSASP